MLYRHVFDKISTEFHGIFRVFVNFADLPEFCGFASTQNIRIPDNGLIQEKVLTYCVSTFWKIIFCMQFEVLCMLCSSVVL